jgi:hypothetical protein
MECFYVGSGGGVTGAQERYRVSHSGLVEALDVGTKSSTRLGNLDGAVARELFSELDKLELHSYEFDHPHNMTYSLGVDRGTEIQWVRWGAPEHAVREDVARFYARATEAIRSLR